MTDNQASVDIDWPEDMSQENRDELRGLLIAYDAALTEFEDDHTVVFPSDAERKRLFYGFLKRWSDAWSRPGLCMHPGCTNTSIPRSHTISLASSIRLIAENDHVVSPQFRENGVELLRIGVRQASTFPGFCNEHEAQFADFETKKAMTEPEHYYLQAFRTICREIYTKRHYQQKSEAMLSEYRRLREDFVTARLKQAHRSTGAVSVTGLRFENDPIETKLTGMLQNIRIDLPELEKLHSGILNDLQNDNETIAVKVANFDIQLPICLSGLGVINYIDSGLRGRALCFLAIIPEAGCTKIMLGATAEHRKVVQAQFSDTSSLAILEMLESWILHGSDHWFMTPSAWAAIPQNRQRAICDRILEPLSLADRAPFSVLDEPRRQIVAFAEHQLANGAFPPDLIEKVEQTIIKERARLDYASSATGVESVET